MKIWIAMASGTRKQKEKWIQNMINWLDQIHVKSISKFICDEFMLCEFSFNFNKKNEKDPLISNLISPFVFEGVIRHNKQKVNDYEDQKQKYKFFDQTFEKGFHTNLSGDFTVALYHDHRLICVVDTYAT